MIYPYYQHYKHYIININTHLSLKKMLKRISGSGEPPIPVAVKDIDSQFSAVLSLRKMLFCVSDITFI